MGSSQLQKTFGYEVVPTFYCNATPSGQLPVADYKLLRDELVASIAATMPVDAVCIELHGAGVSEHVEDIESDIGEHIRRVIGHHIPLVCSLDLHANIYDDMLLYWDAMIGYRLYPHEDQFETGYKVFSLLPKLIEMKRNSEKYAVSLQRLPMILPTTSTDYPFPHFKVNQLCMQLEKENPEKLIDLRLMHGFPFTNIKFPNPVVMCTCTPGQYAFATHTANQVAKYVWSIREEYLLPSFTPADSVREALRQFKGQGPVLIHETNDNTGCGAPGDATYLLRAMLDLNVGTVHGAKFAAFGFFCDKEAVDEAVKIGVGSQGAYLQIFSLRHISPI